MNRLDQININSDFQSKYCYCGFTVIIAIIIYIVSLTDNCIWTECQTTLLFGQ